MIRKLKSGGYRLYSRKKNSKTGKRRNLGTFPSLAKARAHERAANFSNDTKKREQNLLPVKGQKAAVIGNQRERLL